MKTIATIIDDLKVTDKQVEQAFDQCDNEGWMLDTDFPTVEAAQAFEVELKSIIDGAI